MKNRLRQNTPEQIRSLYLVALILIEWLGDVPFSLPQTWTFHTRRNLKVFIGGQRMAWVPITALSMVSKQNWIPVLRAWKRKGAWRGREVTWWSKRWWLEDDFIVQAVDEITRTRWASLQSLESGSVDKLVTQKVQGLGNYGIGTSRRQNEEGRGMGIQGQRATSLRPGDPRKRDDRAMGPEEGLRQLGASPGARWEAYGRKGGTPVWGRARGALTESNSRFLVSVEMQAGREGSGVPSDRHLTHLVGDLKTKQRTQFIETNCSGLAAAARSLEPCPRPQAEIRAALTSGLASSGSQRWPSIAAPSGPAPGLTAAAVAAAAAASAPALLDLGPSNPPPPPLREGSWRTKRSLTTLWSLSCSLQSHTHVLQIKIQSERRREATSLLHKEKESESTASSPLTWTVPILARRSRATHAPCGAWDRLFTRALPFLQLHLEALGGAWERRRHCYPHIRSTEGQECPGVMSQKLIGHGAEVICWPHLQLQSWGGGAVPYTYSVTSEKKCQASIMNQTLHSR